MKIGFASRWLPQDKRSWSGTIHYTYQQISRDFETEIFHFQWSWLLREYLTTQKSFNRRMFGKQTSVEFLKCYSRFFSHKLTRALKKRPVDCLFVPASSQLIAYVETAIPIIYMTDASFEQLQGYYPGFSGLSSYNIRQGIELDRKAFHKAAHCMLASDWTRRSVVSDYEVDPGKISVVPCGANLDEIPAASSLDFEYGRNCRLLFLGVDWERKGGNIVLDAFRRIRSIKPDAQLHIIGCTPFLEITDPSITVIPFLDKNDPVDRSRLDKIFRETDLLFLPTRAECAGVVFSESSAYGIPSITTDTGGVTTYVKNGINGFTRPLNAGGEDYAELICSLLSNKDSMTALKKSSRQYYDENLSWDLWGQKFRELAENLVNAG